MNTRSDFSKVIQYAGLSLAGLALDFFCILGCFYMLSGNFLLYLIGTALMAAVFGFLNSCLRRIIQKDTGFPTIWYTAVTLLLPIVGSAAGLIVILVNKYRDLGYDSRGITQGFCTFSLVTFALMLIFSFVFNRGMKKSQT